MVYSDNILMCLSQGCDYCYQALLCLQHFVKTALTLQDYFFQKMQELLWQPLFRTLTCQFFASVKCKKVPCICHWSVYTSCKERLSPFLWPNANSVCQHKLIEQITPPIFLLQSSKISELVHQLLSWLALTTTELCWHD